MLNISSWLLNPEKRRQLVSYFSSADRTINWQLAWQQISALDVTAFVLETTASTKELFLGLTPLSYNHIMKSDWTHVHLLSPHPAKQARPYTKFWCTPKPAVVWTSQNSPPTPPVLGPVSLLTGIIFGLNCKSCPPAASYLVYMQPWLPWFSSREKLLPLQNLPISKIFQ